MAQNGITFAWTIDGHGSGIRISNENIAEEIRNVGLAWVHINDSDFEARAWIEKEIYYLDRIILDALLAEETHPRYIDYQDGMLLILRGVNLNPDQEPEDMVSLRIWIDSHRIITVERRKVQTIRDIDRRLEEKTGPKNAGEFLTMLTGHLFDHIDDAMTRLHDQLDALEDKLQDNPEAVSQRDVSALRRQAMTFHRYIAPQRDVINHLRLSNSAWIPPIHKRIFSEHSDKVNQMIESLDFLKDRALIVYDELTSLTNLKTNKNLYLLSGITTIFMPLSFITGLLGMNVMDIPGAHAPHAFAYIAIGTIALGILMASIFKWLKWF
ncbi:MAG: zinc transporter ZntB [Micavibrio aeruginosavorus]|uniref:Zinc transporter ZntB n=1 Tax=Micavibrio aeruginosavorus TaxID=349221 RepID=A0A2W5FN62_9BACT|nr:MAG: zinc transporter ZntB [Micavibrio aeruginosavorus]